MKDFVKYTLATVAGLALTILGLIFIGLISISSITSGASSIKVDANSIMKMELEGTISERAQSNPLDIILSGSSTSIGLDDLLSAIQKAKENKNIKGIYIYAGDFSCEIASLQEIRSELADFKAAGKFIIAYGDNYSQSLYYLCSIADKVILNPQGSISWSGLTAQTMFYKEVMDKLGIEMDIFKVGTYKSAVEPYMMNEMSEANREQVEAYIGSTWEAMLAEVSASRNLTTGKLDELADQNQSFQDAQDAVKNGLVDELMYKNDINSYVKGYAGLDEDDDMGIYTISDMSSVARSTPKDKSGNIVAVYYAFGEIDSETSSYLMQDGIQSAEVIKDLKKLEEDDDVKAVVLRVNSPGGSAYGSEQIWYAVSQLKEKKPVIVSMGDYAASGGYYISCNADMIIAQPTTLTGSIGIFGMLPNYGKLLDKVGLNIETVKTNQLADLGDPTRPMRPEEKEIIQKEVERGYDLFLTRCSNGRGISKEDLDKIAQGRVWTGSQAKEIGLVDDLGGLSKAIEIASEKAGIEKYTVLGYPEASLPFTKIFSDYAGDQIRERMAGGTVGTFLRDIDFLNNAEKNDRIQARMPFSIRIK